MTRDLKVAFIGNVDSGKSSLIGTLMKGELDDGRGSARKHIFRHQHEIDSGRTSSISTGLIGFHSDGHQLISKRHHNSSTWSAEMISQADKRIQLIDLAGHEKYFKTTVFGLTGLQPDFAIVLVGANMGVKRMTKEHLGIAIALDIPIVIAVTKIDLAPKNICKETMKTIRTFLSKANKMPMMVKSLEQAYTAADAIQSNRITPIFPLSNVTGDGLDNLRHFMSLVHFSSKTLPLDKESDTLLFPVDDTFQVPGVGFVVSGNIHTGSVAPNDSVKIGPDHNGKFVTCTVRSIETMHTSIPRASSKDGLHVSLAIRSVNKKVPMNRNAFRKGMVIVSPSVDIHQHVSRRFEARVIILHHQTTIEKGYSPVINCQTIRQSARIISISVQGSGGGDCDTLRTGDRALVCFEFISCPEYIPVKARFIFRDGQAKGIGKIIRIVHEDDETVENNNNVI